MNSRTYFYVTFAVYAILSFTLPVRRPIMEGVDGYLEGIVGYVFKAMPYTPVFAMLIIYHQYKYSSSVFFRWTDKLVSINTLYKVAMIIMPIFLMLFVLRLPGIWWSWTTLGLHICTTILLAGILTDRGLRPTTALLAAGSIISLGAGAWEILYQIGIYFKYYEPQGVNSSGIAASLIFIHPLVLGGIAVMLQIWFSKSPSISPSANSWVLYFFLITVIAIVVWFTTGFWVDVLYDTEAKRIYYQKDFDYIGMLSYKGSKVALGLALVFLYVGKRPKGVMHGKEA